MSRPLDPRLLARAPRLRRHLVFSGTVGAATAIATVAQAYWLARVIVLGFEHASVHAATTPLVWAAFAMATRSVLGWMHERAAFRTAADVKAVLRRDVLRRVVEDAGAPGDPSDPSVAGSGTVLTLLTTGLDSLDGYFARFLPQLVLACVVPLVVGAAVATADLTSAAIVVIVVPLVPVFMVLVGLMTRDRVARRWAVTRSLGQHYADLVGGLPTLQIFGRSRGQVRSLREAQDGYRRETMGALRWAFISAFVLDLLSTLSVALVAVAIGVRLVHGGVGLFDGLFVLLLVPEFFLPVRMVGATYHDSSLGQAAAKDALDLLERPERTGGATPPDIRTEAITVTDLCVRYAGRDSLALAPLSARIEPGRILTLTGPSGSGKTTLLHCLLGFVAPASGRLECAGVDVADMNVVGWRRQLAWVPQSPHLLGDTVADALRLGCPAATDHDIRQMLDRLGLTHVDSSRRLSAEPLSVGETRRAALGRALLRVVVGGASLLLLDEPTASLDRATEDEIVARLLELHHEEAILGRPFAIVAVTHRTALLSHADTILRVRPPAEAVARPESLASIVGGAVGRADGGLVVATALTESPARVRPRGPLAASLRAEPGLPARAVGAAGLAAAASAAGVALLLTSAWLISRAAQQPPILTLMVAIVAVRTFGIGRATLRYAERLATHDVALRLLANVRVMTYQALDAMPYARLRRLRSGDLVSRLVGDTETVQDLFVRWVLPVTTCASITAATAAIVWRWSAGAALVILATGVLGALAVGALVRRASSTSERAAAPLLGLLGAEALEIQTASREVVACDAARQAMRGYRRAVDALEVVERRIAGVRGLTGCVVGVSVAAATCGAGWFAVSAASHGVIAPTMVAVLVLAPLALQDLWMSLPAAFQHRSRAVAAAARIGALTVHSGAPPLPESTASAVSLPAPAESGSTPRIELSAVCGGWSGGPSVLRGLTLALEPGSRTLVRGPSGAGKSTLAAVLTGFLEADSGSVTLDGRSYADLTTAAIRRRVGLLEQDVHVFDSTIRENLLIAKPNATTDECLAALADAHLGRMVARLPSGLDTSVGEHGSRLSGGERQRLGIARLLLAGHRVLVLDEPTEHLDPDVGRRMLIELLALAPSRTVVLLTHVEIESERFDHVVDLGPLAPPERMSTPEGPVARRSLDVVPASASPA